MTEFWITSYQHDLTPIRWGGIRRVTQHRSWGQTPLLNNAHSSRWCLEPEGFFIINFLPAASSVTTPRNSTTEATLIRLFRLCSHHPHYHVRSLSPLTLPFTHVYFLLIYRILKQNLRWRGIKNERRTYTAHTITTPPDPKYWKIIIFTPQLSCYLVVLANHYHYFCHLWVTCCSNVGEDGNTAATKCERQSYK